MNCYLLVIINEHSMFILLPFVPVIVQVSNDLTLPVCLEGSVVCAVGDRSPGL